MDDHDVRPERQNDAPVPPDETTDKKEWHEPKLTFVEPALTDHGTLTSVTGQFFGGFTP